MATSPFLTCGLLLQTWIQYSDAEDTKACVEIPCVLISASRVVPVQTHAKVVRSLLKHQALVTDQHVQFPFSFAIIEMIRCRWRRVAEWLAHSTAKQKVAGSNPTRASGWKMHA